MAATESVFIGKGEQPVGLALKYANRHGLVSGATGTGKTVTLQILAEGFSDAGVPVFVADVKSDLAGMAVAGTEKDFLEERATTVGLSPYDYRGFPVTFWDLHGEQGHPIRATVSEMGPLLLSRLLDLNDTQEGILTLAFRVADDEKMLLLDLKDLRALLVNVAERRKELSAEYGNVSAASVGAIQRKLLALEEQGADKFFGEPALELADFLRTDEDGKGIINILAADKLMMTPKLYGTFLLWLLSELFEELPEIGDPDKPIFAFFFDEAHLLFDDCPKALLEKIEQVVRLIRSKGVGVYFVTQNPMDVPDSVSSQLGNRVQHALRAFTPKEKRVIKAAAETFRPNPKFKSEDVITQLGIGEALVSTLLKKGVPSVVEQTLIRPPCSQMGPITKKRRKELMSASSMEAKYRKRLDRHSAYEILHERAEKAAAEAERLEQAEEQEKLRAAKAKKSKSSTGKRRSSRRQSTSEAVFKQAARTATSQIVRSLMRSILGTFKK
ncbi:helicase HerA-like domain-containing protein [Parvularcula sp. IMCC14364]|uniref:helicase HerA-like domain-containing protein n=1 Tax=Parvularcula sp. IMCC14364 TaxID=3067902 RepID=UPI002740B727|nr:helicase HerA-like domain-containing protein [Parvularcula sp. IMCC14364]